MRGDSLRDFYAKTLAVVGLGLLACAGAIVDYWPVNEELPKTPAASGLVRETPVLVQDLSRVIPAPQIRAAAAPRPADFISVNKALVNSLAGADARAVALEDAPLPENLVIVDVPLPAAAIDDEDVLDLNLAPMPDSITAESRRSLGDTLRRTKERFTAARVLLRGAMSGVVGGFRKVSPFFSSSATVPGLN